MGKDLSELASYMRPLAEQLIAQANAAGLDVVIVDTGRTTVEQNKKIADGVSWISYSKHEPQQPEGKSEAIDLVPRSLMTTKLWSPASILWAQLGLLGKNLGLKWGGDWSHHPDPSHFEYIHQPVMGVEESTQ